MDDTEERRAWTKELLESLRRAGLEFLDEVLDEASEGVHRSTVRLVAPVAKGGMRHLSGYVRAYAAERGWSASVERKGCYLTIISSRAASSSA